LIALTALRKEDFVAGSGVVQARSKACEGAQDFV
jgi:hypothetical protein